MSKYLLMLFIVIASGNVFANSLYTGAWSTHTATNEDAIQNSNHRLLAYEYNNIVIGYFRNTDDNDTAVLVYQFNVMNYGNIEFNLGVGINYGYYRCPYQKERHYDQQVCPMLLPEITYTKYKLQPTLILKEDAITISFKWNLE